MSARLCCPHPPLAISSSTAGDAAKRGAAFAFADDPATGPPDPHLFSAARLAPPLVEPGMVRRKTPLPVGEWWQAFGPARTDRLRPCLPTAFRGWIAKPPNAARAPSPLGRKNYLFAGSQAGSRAAAIACTLIETAGPKVVDPKARLADILARIPDGKVAIMDDFWP